MVGRSASTMQGYTLLWCCFHWLVNWSGFLYYVNKQTFLCFSIISNKHPKKLKAFANNTFNKYHIIIEKQKWKKKENISDKWKDYKKYTIRLF